MNEQKQLSEVIDLWKIDKKQYVKKSSFSAYTLLIENHLLPNFGNKIEIEEADVQSFVFQKLETGLSHKTIKDILIVLKMILKFGAKNKWLQYTPFDIQFPTEREKHNIEVLTKTDQKKIMNYIQEHFTFRNLGVYICLSAGMRIGEICALTWKDIDIDNGIISVNRTIQRIYVIEDGNRRTELILDTPKTKNSIREIPISKDLLRILKPFKKIVNPSFFVLTNDTKPTEPRTYRSYYKNLMKELKMPELKFHGLRHSFATRCIESNCDYKTVSVLLGHSNISTTLNLYVHPNMEQKKKAIEQMFKALR
ncbi:tyrosine-type recombinase/integrase [Elizabethkingia anophelis]|uniref:tyrosine-type recombinase/integrase n=1 Tax=Elizabethkingia anophelis TaxID=1117645 RepID=UPI00248E296B|nr:site-specific integrase [Elizabethkingia anophelis]EJC8059403.1 site-specific integrase [Elizabethkingia anophelis]MDV3778795.1 site-specific integrase [Elizabethkingia anophelis]MDV3792086.1 site-specific integrase [Elizabethkingia anophelis]MDV3813606.1 site-specific integrase [Elizabethkingia anophelis]MDV4019396.1 site-specific integrase [Elizabethkingia anophelis]